ncbi:MAG: hypothetical protein J5582_10700 [Ruminococcus sp.]|uniref:DUF6985 domain-containing protein n=1 Tax=Ruminococcus sp. TaxID=41978 RepID=UPI0025E8956C|nr:hypothetical protein [Ruminococcus sp.]MBO4867009.1 hypothetical protein [Ruminococcus sp.]
MNDILFGNLEYNDMQYFCGKVKTSVLGDAEEVDIMIQAEDGSADIAESQREAFRLFSENEDQLKNEVMEGLIAYYNEEVKYSYGDNEMWCDIDTPDDMKAQLEWEWIQIPYSDITDDAPMLYLVFHCKWEDDDPDPQGMAVEITEGQITNIGAAEIAF